jgi:hypothetical protein
VVTFRIILTWASKRDHYGPTRGLVANFSYHCIHSYKTTQTHPSSPCFMTILRLQFLELATVHRRTPAKRDSGIGWAVWMIPPHAEHFQDALKQLNRNICSTSSYLSNSTLLHAIPREAVIREDHHSKCTPSRTPSIIAPQSTLNAIQCDGSIQTESRPLML